MNYSTWSHRHVVCIVQCALHTDRLSQWGKLWRMQPGHRSLYNNHNLRCMHACLLPKLCCHGSSQEGSDPQTTESHFRLACWSHQALLWNITILVAIHDHITIQIEFRHVTVEQLGVADIEPGLIGSPCTSVHGILIFLVHNLSLPVNVHVNRTKFVFPLPHAAAAAQHWKLGAY